MGVALAVTAGIDEADGVATEALGLADALGASLVVGVTDAVASAIARARIALRALTDGDALASAVGVIGALVVGTGDVVGVDDGVEDGVADALALAVGRVVAVDVGEDDVLADEVGVALALASGVALTDAAGVAATRTATFGSQMGSASVFAS